MKIFLYALDVTVCSQYRSQVERAGHIVVGLVTSNLAALILGLARATPRVVVGDAVALTPGVREALNHHFPELPVLAVESDDPQWHEKLRYDLTCQLPRLEPRPFANGSRVIYHDESLRSLATPHKLKRPQYTDGWQVECARQEGRFLLQLQAGAANHRSAKEYLAHLVAQRDGLNIELAYRTTHGSWKALCWSRDLAGKWIALLAHYVPDVELDYLPIPNTPGPAVDYVHHYLPQEGLYAAFLVMVSGLSKTIDNEMRYLLTSNFSGQDEAALLTLNLRLLGLAKFLQQVAMAQVALMDWWLDAPQPLSRDAESADRTERRYLGLYRDFYDLPYIIRQPSPINQIIAGFRSGATYVRRNKALPTFREFQRLSIGCELLLGPRKD